MSRWSATNDVSILEIEVEIPLDGARLAA